MATLLTSSYQKVAETKMGYWYADNKKLGTLYLRTYSKFNSDNSIDIQARVYNDGSYCWSNNCYATLQGENIKNNVRLDFTTKSEIILGTKTVPGGTVNAITTFRCYGLGINNTFTAQAEVTLPSDKATGLDFDIGSATLITITRYNENYNRTVVASIGDYSETLIDKGTETQITWHPSANSLYQQVPNSNIGTITLTATTYDGDTIIGIQTSTLKCRVTESNPVITAVTITDSLIVVAKDTLVRYLSKPKISIAASGVNYAEIASYSVTEQNSTGVTADVSEITLEDTIKTNSFVVTVIDTRGNSATRTVSANNFIEYNLPVISKMDLIRTGEGLDQIQASISGVWYNGEINGTMNTASLKYRYKTSAGEYSNYININESPSQAQFTVETILFPDNGFDVNSIYTIEVVIFDKLTNGNLTSPIGKAIPLTDHWNENDKDYYNINAEIQQYGVPILQEQKILWSGVTHLVETDTIILDETVSSQQNGIVLVWSGYSNGEAKNWNFTYCFIPKQHIELLNGEGVSMQMCGSAFDVLSSKYAYISNTQITGNEHNDRTGKANGITYDNTAFVLRYVIGI